MASTAAALRARLRLDVQPPHPAGRPGLRLRFSRDQLRSTGERAGDLLRLDRPPETSMNSRRTILKASAAAVAALPLRAFAAWPEQVLKIIVPFPPGGTSDVIARLIAKPLGDALGGANVIIENKTGANGAIGAAAV